MDLPWIFATAYALDLLIGDPPSWPHPVRFIGHFCVYWEKRLYRPTVLAGLLYWLAVVASVLIPVIAAVWLLEAVSSILAAILGIYLVWGCLATRSLHLESRAVEDALSRGGLEQARERVSRIVSRDTAGLPAGQIRRAVLETVAENLSDGVVAPIFYFLLLGIPGMLFYKTVNTMDSMVGYRNDRYQAFGKVAARVDDVLNFVPARLTAWIIVLCAPRLGLDGPGTRRIMARDSANASSPNAGWPEAAMAGALGVRLGGPSSYFGRLVEKPTIGDPLNAFTPDRYAAAIKVLYTVSLVSAGITWALLLLAA